MFEKLRIKWILFAAALTGGLALVFGSGAATTAVYGAHN